LRKGQRLSEKIAPHAHIEEIPELLKPMATDFHDLDVYPIHEAAKSIISPKISPKFSRHEFQSIITITYKATHAFDSHALPPFI